MEVNFFFNFLDNSICMGMIHAFFYKNNETQICPKIKNKLRAIEARLQGENVTASFY